MDLITVPLTDPPLVTPGAPSDAPFDVTGEGSYLNIYRQSSGGSLFF